jgi:phosphoribosyl-AMP cyclohydrolase
MFAWMNREALQKTAELGRAVYFSRSRGKLWFKGEESGHVQTVHEIRMDCDNDVMLAQGHPATGPRARHCLPHRPPQLFFQRAERRAQPGKTEPVLKDPESIYKC